MTLLRNTVTSANLAWLVTGDYDGTKLHRARVFVAKLRRKLAGTGWTITVNKGGHGKPGSYRLEREE